MTVKRTMTNELLAKIFSIETVMTIIIGVFCAGIIWSDLSSAVAENAKKSQLAVATVEEYKDELQTMKNTITLDLNSIQTSIAVIKADQVSQNRSITEQVKEVGSQVKEVREILLRKKTSGNTEY